MTPAERINLAANLLTLEIAAGPFVTLVALALSEPWTNWNFLLLFSAAVLGPACYLKILPYSRWLADRLTEFSKKI